MEIRNLLLAALPPDVYDRLEPRMQTVDLKHGDILHRPGQTIDDVYFPIDCLISITVTMAAKHTAEAGIAGSREMVGINAFMGGSETNQTEYICQASGSAIKMDAAPLLEEFDRNKEVRDILLRYTQAYIAQLSQNVGCNRLHSIEQRFARWMLECRDRLGSDDLDLTHEFISEMLGVRRAGITDTAIKLQRQGLIKYGRAKLRVVDASGLGDVACECFGVIRDEYDRLLQPAARAASTA
jgi:CRP-like cAMP-binding protein